MASENNINDENSEPQKPPESPKDEIPNVGNIADRATPFFANYAYVNIMGTGTLGGAGGGSSIGSVPGTTGSVGAALAYNMGFDYHQMRMTEAEQDLMHMNNNRLLERYAMPTVQKKKTTLNVRDQTALAFAPALLKGNELRDHDEIMKEAYELADAFLKKAEIEQ